MEVIHVGASARDTKVVIFDFDGTLSLIRSGWMDVMVPLCVEQLEHTGSGESAADLRRAVEEFVWRLTGKETIYQMMALADAVRARGGTALEPRVYKQMYLDRLWERIEDRVEGLRAGRIPRDRFLVPGARQLLEELASRGLELYLASGTDDANVKEEAALLGVASYFPARIFGAQEDLQSFSKAMLVRQILAQTADVRPNELLVFGDGFVEIEEVKKAGGVAVGLATAEPECLDIDPWKRERLVAVGADFIIPNYLELNRTLCTFFGQAVISAR